MPRTLYLFLSFSVSHQCAPLLSITGIGTVRRNAPTMHFLTAPSSSLLSPHLTSSLLCPPLYFSSASTGRLRRFVLLNEPGSVLNCYKGLCWSCSGFLRCCKDWEGEFSSMESQILEFMQGSDKPGVFPTKEELVAAGRVDLVNAIVNEGGWLAFGWDLNDGLGEIRRFEDRGSGGIEGNATRPSGVASSSSSSRTDGSVGDSRATRGLWMFEFGNVVRDFNLAA